MTRAQWRDVISIAALVGIFAVVGFPGAFAADGRTNNISIAYTAPKSQALAELYETLQDRQVLERTQPF